MHQHNSTWVGCISTDKEFHKNTKQQSSGSDFLQNKALKKDNQIWEQCMTKVMEFHKILS